MDPVKPLKWEAEPSGPYRGLFTCYATLGGFMLITRTGNNLNETTYTDPVACRRAALEEAIGRLRATADEMEAELNKPLDTVT